MLLLESFDIECRYEMHLYVADLFVAIVYKTLWLSAAYARAKYAKHRLPRSSAAEIAQHGARCAGFILRN